MPEYFHHMKSNVELIANFNVKSCSSLEKLCSSLAQKANRWVIHLSHTLTYRNNSTVDVEPWAQDHFDLPGCVYAVGGLHPPSQRL